MEAQRTHLVEPPERLHQGRCTDTGWCSSQLIERTLVGTAGDGQQILEALPNGGVRQFGQAAPEPQRRPVADARDESGQGGDAGEQRLLLDQASRGQVEQDARPLGTEPGPRVQPAHQPEVPGLVGELTVAVALADLRRVVPARVAAPVRRQIGRGRHLELRRHVRNDISGYIGWVGQEGAQEPDRDELERHAEAVVVAASLGHERAVGVVKVEVAGELGRRGRTGVPAVPLLLLVGEELDRHRPRA
jgi:hypothetical protein